MLGAHDQSFQPLDGAALATAGAAIVNVKAATSVVRIFLVFVAPPLVTRARIPASGYSSVCDRVIVRHKRLDETGTKIRLPHRFL